MKMSVGMWSRGRQWEGAGGVGVGGGGTFCRHSPMEAEHGGSRPILFAFPAQVYTGAEISMRIRCGSPANPMI